MLMAAFLHADNAAERQSVAELRKIEGNQGYQGVNGNPTSPGAIESGALPRSQ
jgi:hypothetical protein